MIVNGIGLQTEIITQKNQGRDLEIFATNPAGQWNRTLIASGTVDDTVEFVATNATLVDPDGDTIQVESFWEDDGTVHRSILRGKPRLGGGSVESLRYLEGQDVLICESRFHPPPSPSKFLPAQITWRFARS